MTGEGIFYRQKEEVRRMSEKLYGEEQLYPGDFAQILTDVYTNDMIPYWQIGGLGGFPSISSVESWKVSCNRCFKECQVDTGSLQRWFPLICIHSLWSPYPRFLYASWWNGYLKLILCKHFLQLPCALIWMSRSWSESIHTINVAYLLPAVEQWRIHAIFSACLDIVNFPLFLWWVRFSPLISIVYDQSLFPQTPIDIISNILIS